jgi:hypothetical protein
VRNFAEQLWGISVSVINVDRRVGAGLLKHVEPERHGDLDLPASVHRPAERTQARFRHKQL